MPDRLAALDERNRQALARSLGLEMLDFHLQAKVRIGDARLDSFELLLRGSDSSGLVGPMSIIDRVKEREAGTRLDFAEIMTCRALVISRELRMRRQPVPVAINIDETDLIIEDLPEAMLRLIEERAPDERAIELEITERDRIGDPHRIAAILAPFAEKGIRMALDDAGFGESYEGGGEDLRRIHALPVQSIKLDRGVLFGDDHSSSKKKAGRAFRHARHIARQYGIEHIVAEGIETETHLAWCREHGIPIAQGYRFHKPEALDAALVRFG
ncbi:protein of unknown function (Diguanylate phosphodiesterase, EAL domain 15-259) (plasmid) [Magnetospirillum sp. XM-1]|uniref:EAL domain-containing protein n=1 Tax=Magnetospirillum sp. XM-1 TaxID=1663591 RepID=UPI00073DF58C|nr:EAL domain-containing protein [Magnetospirillum sp. XM-1]CUW41969.1 protein of unknown function (Diguanylate phosphodiesterase, EAL domain 15-259) [Magnetospirillum sp. XM-1]